MSDPQPTQLPYVPDQQAQPPPPVEPGPQIGDKYTDGTKVVTVTAVGEKHALAKEDNNPAAEDKYPLIPISEGGTFRPVIPADIVYADTVLYEYHIQGAEQGLWTNPTVASATGRKIVLHRGTTATSGTWTQVT